MLDLTAFKNSLNSRIEKLKYPNDILFEFIEITETELLLGLILISVINLYRKRYILKTSDLKEL